MKAPTNIPDSKEEANELADNGRNTGGQSYYRGQPTGGAESAPEAQTAKPGSFTATASFGPNGYSVSWVIGNARYHVWLDEKGLVTGAPGCDGQVLYKNSVAKYRQPGHFDCRHLDASAKANRKMVEAAIAQVDIRAAKVAFDREEAEKEAVRMADIKARDAKERLEAAAPELLEALQALLNADLNSHAYHIAREDARAAISKATQP